MHPHAKAALHAAEWRTFFPRKAIHAYLQQRGVPLGLYRLACQLKAATKQSPSLPISLQRQAV